MNEGPERIDYRETSDVTEVHAAIKREHRDPSAEVTPIPLWLSAVCGIAICWAGAYLGVFHGGFSSTVYNEYDSSPSKLFPPRQKLSDSDKKPPVVELTLAQQGKVVYGQCVTCHQPTGMGIAGQFPPLAKSEYVTGSEKRLVAILLKGLQGPITVEGKPYNGVMPPWEGSLSDKKIAAVASYVRAEWGNGAPEISEAKVAAARKEFAGRAGALTEADLLQIPADATLPDAAGAAPAPAAPAAPAATTPTPAPAAATTTPVPAAAIPDVTAPAVVPVPATPVAAAPDPAVLAKGKAAYMTICFACHQATGGGLPPVFPPLTKTDYVLGDAKRFAAMILKGVAGPITVNGTQYSNIMPGQEAALSDDKIAAILTYVRASFGNNASPVSTEIVAAARKEFAAKTTPWSEAELKAFGAPASAPAPEAAAPAPVIPALPETPTPAPATPAPAPTVPAPAVPATPVPAPTAPVEAAPATPAPTEPAPVPPAPAPVPEAPAAPAPAPEAPAPVAPVEPAPATPPTPAPAAPNPAQ